MITLKNLSIWNKLSTEEQNMLNSSAKPQHYKKGEILHDGNVKCTGLILVSNGQLRAFTNSEDGREITLYRLFEQDLCLFSASCMLNSLQFDITITAEKDTDVLIIPADVYKSIMKKSAPLANFTNEIMASRFSDVMWLIDNIMWKSFDKRLAEFLLNEANIEETNILSITHEGIGKHLGNPREVVTRMLKYFVSEGLITLSRGTIKIIDEKGLRNLSK